MLLIREDLGEDPPVLVQPHVKQGNPAKVLIDQLAAMLPLCKQTLSPVPANRLADLT